MRAPKASRIVRLIQQQRGDLHGDMALEIGCATCGMTRIFENHFRRVIAVDVDRTALESCGGSHAVALATAAALPFKPEAFDVVIANHVLEFAPDIERTLDEMSRVLKATGLIYLAVVNALKFLPARLLPRSVRGRYVRAIHSGEDNIGRPYTYLQWRRLLGRYTVRDWTLATARSADPSIPAAISWFVNLLPQRVLQLLGPFYPSWVLILTKPRSRLPTSFGPDSDNDDRTVLGRKESV